jgi:hypothetical protein
MKVKKDKKWNYSKKNLEKLNSKINNADYIKARCKKNAKDFTRDRKLTPKELILYNINNRGKTIKMELNDFLEKCSLEDVSDVALLKQREKLNEEVFKILNDESMIDFYANFKNEVKTYKGYILTAIDGSDCEVPNTLETRQRYKAKNSKPDNKIARIKLSNCYDVLNNFILDTQIGNYKYNEIALAEEHTRKVNELIDDYKHISIRDRGYPSLSYIYRALKHNEKFVIRLDRRFLKKERFSMTSDDEWLEIEYQYDRIKNFKDKDPEFYEYYEQGNTMNVRVVNIPLSTGEIETLVTNLDENEFSAEDLNYIYGCRWGIETNYDILKNSMMITNISSSKDGIIKQEIYSTMLVFNTLQGLINGLESEIEQEKYKHKMKVNFNMALGFTKRYLILILIQEDIDERKRLSDLLFKKILDNIVPVRPNRKYPRNKKNNAVYNKYPINKRKSY